MNKIQLLILPIALLLSACSSVSDNRPEPVRKSEYYLEHGVTAFENSDYVSATSFLLKALAHYRSIDDTTGILLSRINLAETSLAAGNFPAADEHINAAEIITDKTGYKAYKGRITLLHAQTQWRKGETDRALLALSSLLPSFDEEQRSNQKTDLFLLGATTLRTDIAFANIEESPAEANLWLTRLSRMLASTPGKTSLHEARLLRFEARIALINNKTNESLKMLDRALELYRQSAARPALAATLEEAGSILMQQEDWEAAEDKLQRALYIRLWILDRVGAHEVMKMLHELYTITGNLEKARELQGEMEKSSQSQNQ